jgi:hypothetical protein
MEDEEGKKQDEIYERIKNSRFKQQNLPAWRPVPTMGSTIFIFVSIGIIFITFGIILSYYSNKINEIKFRYDDQCPINDTCQLQINITYTMKKDIMIYYELDNFYQNHRRYVKSRNNDQLKGKKVSDKTLEDDCDPVVTNNEMGKTENIFGEKLIPDEIAVPCGLIAKSYFNDTFSLSYSNGTTIEINQNNIAFKADKEKHFNNLDLNKQWIDMTDEHFIVWMRPAAFPNFRKLWGRIYQDLKEGEVLILTITNNYDVSGFKGKKYFILSEINKLGQNNILMGGCYIIVGGSSIILALIFSIGYNIKKNREKEE